MKSKVKFKVFVVVILMVFVLTTFGDKPKETKQLIGKLTDEKDNPIVGETLWLIFAQEGSFYARLGFIERNGKGIIDWSMPSSVTNKKGEFVIEVGKKDTDLDFSIGTKKKGGKINPLRIIGMKNNAIVLEAEVLQKSRQINFGIIILNKDNKLLIKSKDQIIIK